MYVTKPLSYFKRHPEALSIPPEGPNSGYLVIQDEEAENYTFFGLLKDRFLKELPLPQNKDLTVRYSSGVGDNKTTHFDDITLVPVLNQPLSSNRYYAIQRHGKHKGGAFTCSKEEDATTCCFSMLYEELKPKPLNPQNLYQQFEISPYEGSWMARRGEFIARSVSQDGIPPKVLRRKGWEIKTKTPKNYELREAPGIDVTLRAQLPEFNFPTSHNRSEAVVVGKWYCPFMFIKEEGRLGEQMKRSMFYEMTLEQRWERIYALDRESYEGDTLSIDMAVQTEVVSVGGRDAVWDERNVADGTIWFTSFRNMGEEVNVGLRVEILQRVKWEEERVGWFGGNERMVRVMKNEECVGVGGWKRFGCYVLVERFELKRMDGSLVMTYDFRHTHQIKSKFE